MLKILVPLTEPIQNCIDLNGGEITVKLLLEVHTQFLLKNNYIQAADSLNQAWNICNSMNPSNSSIKSKVMHLLLTDYIVEVDRNIGTDPIGSIQLLLDSFSKNEYSIDLADGYNRFGVYNKNKKMFVEAIKAFIQEYNIRVHLTPGDYNSLYANLVSTFVEMFKNSSDNLKNDLDVTIKCYLDINGAEASVKLLMDIHAKRIGAKAYDQARDCLNKAIQIYSEANLNDLSLKYAIYHSLFNIDNILFAKDHASLKMDSPVFVRMNEYLNELTQEQAIIELNNTAINYLIDIYPLKSVEFLLRAAIICFDTAKPQTSYFDQFENIFRVLVRNPVLLLVPEFEDKFTFENEEHLAQMNNKFYRFINAKFVLNNSLEERQHPITTVHMYQYVASKYLIIKENDNCDFCLKASSYLYENLIPNDELELFMMQMTEFEVRKKNRLSMNKIDEVIQMLKNKSSYPDRPKLDLKDKECLNELTHIAENCVHAKTPDYKNGLDAFMAALEYSKLINKRNNMTTVTLLHDIALAFHEFYNSTGYSDENLESLSKAYEKQYDLMIQMIHQGIY